MKYNYVVFDCNDNVFFKTILSDLYNKKNIKVYNKLMQDENKVMNFLYKLHNSKKIENKNINLPFKFVWNRKLFNYKFDNDLPICFMFASHLYYLRFVGFFEYLKKKYPNCKMVYYCRDLFSTYPQRYKNFDEKYVKKTFDYIITYNKADADKYGITFFSDFESMQNISVPENAELSDVLFVGAAKDRLNLILDTYKKLTDAGLKCDFYVTGVPESKQVDGKGIFYAEKWLTYSEVLNKIATTKCIIEIVQGNTCGFSSRGMKAFGYNKKLLTNAIAAKYVRFYDEKHVQYFETVDDINPEFLLNGEMPDYNYNNEFSPLKVLDFVDKLLTENISSEEYYKDWFDVKGMAEEFYNNSQMSN